MPEWPEHGSIWATMIDSDFGKSYSSTLYTHCPGQNHSERLWSPGLRELLAAGYESFDSGKKGKRKKRRAGDAGVDTSETHLQVY